VRGAERLHAAPAVAVGGDLPHRDVAARMTRQSEEDSPAFKMLDDSRTLDLHIGSVNRLDPNAMPGIGGKTAAGWRGNGSRYRVSGQAQLDMIRSEGDTRICPGHGQRDRARDIAHQPAIVENKHRAGNGSADVCGLDASRTKK